MRMSNNVDLVRFSYRDPVAATTPAYITRETLIDANMTWGFAIEAGIYPSTEPATLDFTIGFPKSLGTSTEWDDFTGNADIGYEIQMETLESTAEWVPTPVGDPELGEYVFVLTWTDTWVEYGPTFYIKSMAMQPDVYGGLKYSIVCEDLLARAMTVPITYTDITLGIAQKAVSRTAKIMGHISDYYDNVFSQFETFYINGETFSGFGGGHTYHSITQPAVTGGAYTAEPASGILNTLLRLDLAFILFNNNGYELRNIDWYRKPTDPPYPTLEPGVDYGFFSNVQRGRPEPGYDYEYVSPSSMTFANDNDEVISCLRVELADDDTNYYSWQDADAILKYGAKYVKESIGAAPVSMSLNSVDVWGKSIATPNSTERLTNVTFSAIAEVSGRLKQWQYNVRPARTVSATYWSDHYNHGDYYTINKVSHSISQNAWDISVDLWKPSLQNGWFV